MLYNFFIYKMSEEFTKFLTVYSETKKIVVLSEFEDLYNTIQSVYKNLPGFPKKIQSFVWRQGYGGICGSWFTNSVDG